ncbi:MAG: hypothetical protein M1817_005599 [Caeruleum heppii]|nr:MAG: hypothetical protein M1817_005599 [Caeruleum heppii]
MVSTAHELGVLFGFVAAMIVSMAAYAIGWQLVQKRIEKQDAMRRQALSEKGIGEKGHLYDAGGSGSGSGNGNGEGYSDHQGGRVVEG